MPQLINRVPPGLLSLLDIKSLGQNPVQLGDQLIGTMDLLRLYAEATIQNLNGTVNTVNAVGHWEFTSSGTRMRPEAGELWIVQRMAVRPVAVLGAGTTYTFSMATITSFTGDPTLVGREITGTVGSRPSVSLDSFVMTAQTAAALYVHSLTLGIAANFRCDAQVAILRI